SSQPCGPGRGILCSYLGAQVIWHDRIPRVPSPRKGEGQGGGRARQYAGRSGRRNLLQNAVEVLQNVAVPESQHLDAFCVEPTRSSFIIGGRNRNVVLPAVNLDSEANRRTIEIKNILADRMLPAEAQAVDLIAAQRSPKSFFSFGRFF